MGEASGSEDLSLDKRFIFCEKVIEDLEHGTRSSRDMQESLKKCEIELKAISQEASALSLFSRNETVSDVPTSSLQYFLVPSFLATVTQNLIGEAKERLLALDRAKIYLQDFLERLYSYEIINFNLSWLHEVDNVDDSQPKQRPVFNPAQLRNEKIQRHQKMKEMQQNFDELKRQRLLRPDDDSVLRDLLLTRLQLAARKAMDDLEVIEMERPLVERKIMISRGEIQPEPVRPSSQSKTPFVIARDTLQKEVFGLGYPSIPTVTVDEWCDDMLKRGRFHKTENADEKKDLPDSDDESEEAEEMRRKHKQNWDEYKDTHRRGWGNTKNKG